jgi:flagellar P-ring protein precursor FlgI
MAAVCVASVADASTRVKDIAVFHGMRSNNISGAGLVIGLNRTGDSARSRAAILSLMARLQGQGMSVTEDDILSRNIALVTVTATITTDARSGQTLDVTLASTADARSLQGGLLLATPLIAPNGVMYAVASGPVVLGGFSAESGGNSTTQNTTTTGRVAGGATVEFEDPNAVDFNSRETVELVLHQSDFTTATRLAQAVNTQMGTELAVPSSSSSIEIAIPEEFRGRFALFAAQIEAVELSVDAPARVIVNERTGTVVMGANVRVSAVAVAHGGLTIEVRRDPIISQPGALSGGTTVLTSQTSIEATVEDGEMVVLEGVTIGALVSGLNDMGVKPRDLMVILEAIHAAGALHAEIVGI